MAAVPQRVLNWLYSVLTNEYQDINRTFKDVAQSLSAYSSLSPRTEVYTYEHGSSSLLVVLSGTIPVEFRGTVYRFPIAIWMPYGYPREAPMIYVTPTNDMRIRPGQHVDGAGRVYHPYLAGWSRAPERSVLIDFLSILRDIFAKEPPVEAKIQQLQHQSTRTLPATPPPVPPLPVEIARPALKSTVAQVPPKPPPKPPASPGGQGQPPLPPIPGRQPDRYSGTPPNGYAVGGGGTPLAQMPSRVTSLRQNRGFSPQLPIGTPTHSQHQGGGPYSPVSPIIGDSGQLRSPPPHHPQHPQQQQPLPQSNNLSYPPHSPTHPVGYAPHPSQYRQPPANFSPGGFSQTGQQYGSYPPPQPSHYPQQPQPAQRPPPKQLQPDIIDAPLELPSLADNPSNLPAPPIPPNPEKDALLSALSGSLTQLNAPNSVSTLANTPLTAGTATRSPYRP